MTLHPPSLPLSPSGFPSLNSSPATSLNVLFVDDELCIRQVMRALLRDVGLRAETAADGFDALRQLSHGHWDLVFTDYAMPGMNGGELAHEIKKRAPDMPVIMVTGLSNLELDRAVVDAVFEKPFTRAKIFEAVWQALLRKSERATD